MSGIVRHEPFQLADAALEVYVARVDLSPFAVADVAVDGVVDVVGQIRG